VNDGSRIAVQSRAAHGFGRLGRLASRRLQSGRAAIEHLSGVWALFVQTLAQAFVEPWRRRSRLRAQLFPMLGNVGVKSFPIVSLVSILIGSILVIQTGSVLKQYGQLDQLPKLVALSMTREFGPVMTAIIMTARVGASYTAVLASMKINDEVMALETMAIHPVGYLVVPRFLAMVVMMPCLTVLSYLLGMVGGGVAAAQLYDITPSAYAYATITGMGMIDLWSGLLKALVFSVIISMVSCYYGLITEGGPMGLGRNTMVSVVTTLVVIIIADAILGAYIIRYILV
jgi:phospholipid/cholesterol/gamma-HCH transport system permease protein